MVSANVPVESFINSIQAVKHSLLPVLLGVRNVAEDLESHWGMNRKKGNNLESITEPSGGNKKVPICIVKKSSDRICIRAGNDVHFVVSDERKKGFSPRILLTAFLGMVLTNKGNGDDEMEVVKKGLEDKDLEKENGVGVNCLQIGTRWSLMVNRFVQDLLAPFEIGERRIRKVEDNDEMVCKHFCGKEEKSREPNEVKQRQGHGQSANSFKSEERIVDRGGKQVSFECFVGFIFDQLNHNLQKPDCFMMESSQSGRDCPTLSPRSFKCHHPKALKNIWEIPKVDVNAFLKNLNFARVGNLPSNVISVTSSVNGAGDDGIRTVSREETDVGVSSPQKLASGILGTSLSNVERLRSTFSNVSVTELIELLPQLGHPSTDYPDKEKLFSVQDFYRYTEAEGKRFFDELDRDNDGQVSLEDLEIAMGKRKLPTRYARELMRRTRSHLFSRSFGWKQFLSLMEEKEPTILRAYTSLCLSKSGTLQKNELLASLKNAGLPANDENAAAMMRFLSADTKESISYGHFRNFMLLLTSGRRKDDLRNAWFKAATVVPLAQPAALDAENLIKSALAGGLSCALSAFIMHPIDTIKTQVQASTLSFPEIISKIPEIGAQGLFKGSIPAVVGQFYSHGLRTAIFEASKLVLVKLAPTLPAIQVQSTASFYGTFLGTVMRIPCEVLKQRLQANLFDNVGEALVGTWHQDGLRGLFRGTGVTLLREVPFYVFGMGLYNESKKIVQQLLGRELEPWETIAVGALSGGFTAVLTTPFDVIKTRMMIAPQGQRVSMWMVGFSILRHEGPLALYRGALPRFFWTAPLGAMNLAGYELIRKAMDKPEDPTVYQLSRKQD